MLAASATWATLPASAFLGPPPFNGCPDPSFFPVATLNDRLKTVILPRSAVLRSRKQSGGMPETIVTGVNSLVIAKFGVESPR
jgi:hypothetical protein